VKVLILHNRYRQPGGEDQVVLAEEMLLRERGAQVRLVEVDNGAPQGEGLLHTIAMAGAAAWSPSSYSLAARICREFQPDVVHIHNFWMSLSPSVHAACRASGAATVQTLHNFRLLCTNALLLRDGHSCTDCVGRTPWRGVTRSCYRGSLAASAAVAGMITANRLLRTWQRSVDAFIALSHHSRSQFVAGRIPADRLFVKPNFREDPGEPARRPHQSGTFVFAGRLSPEKGLDTLVEAWTQARLPERFRLFIVGEGPARESLTMQARALGLDSSRVTFTGQRSPSQVIDLIGEARAVVLPSLCFENFPALLAEAYACGRPVIASDSGALGELVAHETTGLKSPPGDAVTLAAALRRIALDDALADHLGAASRREYLARYTPEENHRGLLRIYRFAAERRGRALPRALSSFAPATVTEGGL
jgi:glycosyltransferase involved in cell wall biosynthesis